VLAVRPSAAARSERSEQRRYRYRYGMRRRCRLWRDGRARRAI